MTIPKFMTGALAAIVLAAVLAVGLDGLLTADARGGHGDDATQEIRGNDDGPDDRSADDSAAAADTSGRRVSTDSATTERRADRGRVTLIRLQPGDAYPLAKGKAKFKAQGSERELEIEGQHLRGLIGQQLIFSVGGREVGRATVNQFGKAELELNTEDGDVVPESVSQQRVTVETQDGVLVQGGFFP